MLNGKTTKGRGGILPTRFTKGGEDKRKTVGRHQAKSAVSFGGVGTVAGKAGNQKNSGARVVGAWGRPLGKWAEDLPVSERSGKRGWA